MPPLRLLPLTLLAAPALSIALGATLAKSAAIAHAQGPVAPSTRTAAGTPMIATAKGPFDVKLTPQGNATDPAAVGRMTLDKVFHGDLEATSVGEMLAVRTAVANSAGYVAIERVTGTLAGRKGTFALQHWGVMDRGAQDLRISVIPDSATGDLAGLVGTMTIDIQPGGKHFYSFAYTLPSAAK
jgi:hypothetical protein